MRRSTSFLALIATLSAALGVECGSGGHGQDGRMLVADTAQTDPFRRSDVVTPEMVEEFLRPHRVAARDPVDKSKVPEITSFFDDRKIAWPPPAHRARNPYQRAAVTRNAEPPFGPEVLPILAGPGYSIDDWEQAYYEGHPEEYSRFVALFGDILDVR